MNWSLCYWIHLEALPLPPWLLHPWAIVHNGVTIGGGWLASSNWGILSRVLQLLFYVSLVAVIVINKSHSNQTAIQCLLAPPKVEKLWSQMKSEMWFSEDKHQHHKTKWSWWVWGWDTSQHSWEWQGQLCILSFFTSALVAVLIHCGIAFDEWCWSGIGDQFQEFPHGLGQSDSS